MERPDRWVFWASMVIFLVGSFIADYLSGDDDDNAHP